MTINSPGVRKITSVSIFEAGAEGDSVGRDSTSQNGHYNGAPAGPQAGQYDD
jgi:hypothetical protein